ncbi:MAG: TRAP transporter small permease [Ostreibacterium sp.]
MKKIQSFLLKKYLFSILVLSTNIALFVMMMITVADIILRSLLNAPITGSIEITQFSLAIMIVCAFPMLVWDESHISVDLLDNIIPQWVVPWRQLVIHLVAVIALSLLTLQLYQYGQRASRYGDVTEFLRIPKGYALYMMSAMGGVTVLMSGLRFFYYLSIILGGQPQSNSRVLEEETND